MGVNFNMFTSTFILLLAPLAMAGALPASPEDPCYQKDLNCFIESQSEIGHFGFLPDIWSCEMACRTSPPASGSRGTSRTGSTCATCWRTATGPSMTTSASQGRYPSVPPTPHQQLGHHGLPHMKL